MPGLGLPFPWLRHGLMRFRVLGLGGLTGVTVQFLGFGVLYFNTFVWFWVLILATYALKKAYIYIYIYVYIYIYRYRYICPGSTRE